MKSQKSQVIFKNLEPTPPFKIDFFFREKGGGIIYIPYRVLKRHFYFFILRD